jgi:glycosyltransferase involved in cell wall biosynthesis
MRILVLAPQWPDPPRQGAAIRNLHILRYLAQHHRVTLLTFEADGDMERPHLEQLCEHVEALPVPTRSTPERLRTILTSPLPDMAWRLWSDAMMARVRSLCDQSTFDAIHIEGIEMARYVVQSPKSKVVSLESKIQNPKSKIVYDAHNAEYLLQRRAFTTDVAHLGRWHKALYSLVQWWRLRRFERQVCLASDHVLAVSQADKRVLTRLSPGIEERGTLLPNGVDPAYWSRDADYPTAPIRGSGDTLVFDGSMDFRPNVDAVRWFTEEVWPIIRAERPGARFYIVGRNPTREVQALGRLPGITVTGSVDDPRSWVAAATVYVVPMRMGGGVRLKVLQAMAMGCALVSTPMGMEGIEVQPGKEALMARSPQAFAEATISILSDPQRRAKLGLAARETAATHYAWPTLLPVLDSIYPLS